MRCDAMHSLTLRMFVEVVVVWLGNVAVESKSGRKLCCPWWSDRCIAVGRRVYLRRH
jgi:hypothetical protein